MAAASTHVNLHDELMQHLAQLFDNESMSDVEVAIVGGDTYRLHRSVLAQSPSLGAILESCWREGELARVVLNEDPDCLACVEKFLKFFYTGQIDVSAEDILPLGLLASKYEMMTLADHLDDKLSQVLSDPPSADLLVRNFLLAAKHDMENIYDELLQLIEWNLDTVLRSEAARELPELLVEDILKDTEVVVTSEFHLFTAVLIWLTDRDVATVCQLVVHIRFSLMTSDQISVAEDRLKERLGMELFKQHFAQPLLTAYKYQTFNRLRRQKLGLEKETSRLYSSLETQGDVISDKELNVIGALDDEVVVHVSLTSLSAADTCVSAGELTMYHVTKNDKNLVTCLQQLDNVDVQQNGAEVKLESYLSSTEVLIYSYRD